MITLYMHTNRVTNKAYIGFTALTIHERWQQHVCNARSYTKCVTRKLWNALRKYGTACWDHGVLGTCETVEEAKQLEITLITKYDTYHSGYNSTKGGDGLSGYRHSTETKRKISNRSRGVKRTVAFRNNVSRTMREIHKHRTYHRRYLVTGPTGELFYTSNLKRFCREMQLPSENLRCTLKTNKPCPYTPQGWMVQYV